MEIRIKERVHEYKSDFPEGWKFSRGDYFKFPVNVGGNNCFIKRFDKRTENIPGWKLLNDLNGKYEPTLSRIYNIAETNENTTTVHYVFFEFIEGQTLYELISKKVKFDLQKLTVDLFAALETLQNKGYWFPDFFEKNMFAARSGRFLLIDLDSTYPIETMPDKEMWGSKEYWALVFNFCKENLHHTGFIPAQFNGASFNYLHAIFLIMRLKFFYDGEDEIEYDSTDFFNQIPYYLNNISPSFRDIFEKVYQNKERLLAPEEISEIKEMVLKEIIPLSAAQIKNIIRNKRVLEATPVINKFEVNNYIEKTGDKYLVASGELFSLDWDVENGTSVELYKNEELVQRFNNSQKNIGVREEAGDKGSTKIKYKLVAFNDTSKTEKTLSVEIISTLSNLRINDFSVINYAEKNENEYTIESGQTFTLQWNTGNTQKVKLLRNNQPYKQFNNSESSIDIKEDAYDGKEKLIEYTLVASSSDDSLDSEEQTSLTVRIVYRKQSITEFALQNYLEKNNNDYVVESGKPFTLTWNVSNAAEIQINKNGQPLKKVSSDEKSIELTENVYDATEKKLNYTLTVSSADGSESTTKSLNVTVKISRPVHPVIKQFISNKYTLRNGGAFTLSWDVQNASEIVLYKNEGLYKTFNNGEKNAQLNENYEGRKKAIKYTLVAINGSDEVRSRPLTVLVKPPFNILKIALFIFALLAISYAIYYVASRKDTGEITFYPLSINKVSAGDTMTISGKNIPENDSSFEVKFSEVSGKIIQLTADSMRVIVPILGNNAQETDVTASLKTKDYLIAQKLQYSINYARPVLYSFNKTTITQNDIITLLGENLPVNDTAIHVAFNQVNGAIIQLTPDSISVRVPELKDKVVDITVRSGSIDTVLARSVLYQKAKAIITIFPLTEHVVNEGGIVTIFGDNIPQKGGNLVVKFNNIPASIIKLTSKSIQVQVPSLPDEPGSVTILVSEQGQVLATEHVSYQHMQVDIYPTTQTKITEGQNIYFSGRNIPLDNGAVEVLFNNVRGNILLQARSLLQVKIPSLAGNSKQMSVTIVVRVNGKDYTVATNVQYQRLVESPPDLCGLTTVSFTTRPRGILGGKREVHVTIKNNSKYNMDIVTEIFFIYGRRESRIEELTASNVEASSSKAVSTVIQGRDIKVDSIKVTIKSIQTKEFGIQKCK